MSLIGTLEQINLSLVLQGVESYKKTGLLIMKQEAQWVELYFRDGRLMCIGPVNANATLGDRLLQAGVISQQALQDVLLTIGEAQLGETRIALTLMELGYVDHEDLRAWAAQEATAVLKILLAWKKGTIYFEEGQQPPADRLLIALSYMSLLPALSQAASTEQQAQQISQPLPPLQPTQTSQPLQAQSSTPAPASSQSLSQLMAEASPQPSAASFASPVSTIAALNLFSDQDAPNAQSLTPPQPITAPLTPIMVDTSSLRPEMVLIPVDLSSLREQNPRLQLTPERWRLLTRVDGRTTLQQACNELAMSAETIRQIAGELIVLGLVLPMTLTLQQAADVQEPSPVSRELLAAGLGNGYGAPGYAAAPVQPWSAITPITGPITPTYQASSSLPFATQSQWGNGGNGANFVPGKGWVAVSQPLQPLQSSGPLYLNGVNGMTVPITNGR